MHFLGVQVMNGEELLAQVGLFAEIGQRNRKRLARVATTHKYGPGDVIMKEGEPASAFFIIASGKVEVVKGVDSKKPRVLATLGSREFFGEMALFEGYPRSATVRALENTECLTLNRWDFLEELRAAPTIGMRILAVVVRRLRELETKVVE